MNALCSRVIAPCAAALMIGFTMTAPVQAAVPSGGSGQSATAPNSGGSAPAEQHRADDAQQSARDNRADDRTDDRADDRTEPRTAEARPEGTGSSAGAGSQGSRDGASSNSSGVQIDRPNDYQAQADPDGDDNGGVDQPGGTGGYPIDEQGTKDQDGNNGTGNDLDCEDDNRGKGVPGHCDDTEPVDTPDLGGVSGEECPSGQVMDEDGECVTPTEECPQGDMNGHAEGCEAPPVRGGVTPQQVPGVATPIVLGVEKSATPPAAGFVEDVVNPASPEVLGVEQTAPAALPQTGAAEYLTLLTLAGLGLTTAGALTLLFRRRLESGR